MNGSKSEFVLKGEELKAKLMTNIVKVIYILNNIYIYIYRHYIICTTIIISPINYDNIIFSIMNFN